MSFVSMTPEETHRAGAIFVPLDPLARHEPFTDDEGRRWLWLFRLPNGRSLWAVDCGCAWVCRNDATPILRTTTCETHR